MYGFPEPVTLIYIVTAWTVLMTVLSLIHKKKFKPVEKKVYFTLIALPILLVTLYTAGHTVAKNVNSVTGGPVHWHIDYQIHICGERVDLIDPNFPSNKIGTPLFHEHNDDRLHVEGTVMDLDNVKLGPYFEVLGGRLTPTSFALPLDDGRFIDVTNGDECTGQASTLKVFINGERMENPDDYLYYPHAYVPPGDCAIIEFSPENAQTTDKVCESWTAKNWDYTNYQELRQDWTPDNTAAQEYRESRGWQ